MNQRIDKVLMPKERIDPALGLPRLHKQVDHTASQ